MTVGYADEYPELNAPFDAILNISIHAELTFKSVIDFHFRLGFGESLEARVVMDGGKAIVLYAFSAFLIVFTLPHCSGEKLKIVLCVNWVQMTIAI